MKSKTRKPVERYAKRVNELEKENKNLRKQMEQYVGLGCELIRKDHAIELLEKEIEELKEKNDAVIRSREVLFNQTKLLKQENDDIRQGRKEDLAEWSNKEEGYIEAIVGLQVQIKELKKNQAEWNKSGLTHENQVCPSFFEKDSIVVHWNGYHCTIPLPPVEVDPAEEAYKKEYPEHADKIGLTFFTRGFRAALKVADSRGK